jgi:hypothetical protein
MDVECPPQVTKNLKITKKIKNTSYERKKSNKSEFFLQELLPTSIKLLVTTLGFFESKLPIAYILMNEQLDHIYNVTM